VLNIAHKEFREIDQPTIFVIDDDDDFRTGLVDLLASMDMRTLAFSSAREFLNGPRIHAAGCILLDVEMPGLNGLDLQAHLESVGCIMPIIFLTGHGDIPMTVRALKAGASDFLEKPFHEQALINAVTAALARSEKVRKDASEAKQARQLAETLTPREREVMYVVCRGLMNKQIAFELGISEITVKIHRGNVMKKMQVRSVPELIRLADLLGPVKVD
jgi:FixJ family two-component response regulator